MSRGGDRSHRLPIVGQPGPPAPERRDARENRARILAAARKLLRAQPIGEICMDQLAKEAGVGKGTVYRRFENRAALVEALLGQDATDLQNEVLSGFGLAPSAAWLVRLERFLAALMAFVLANAPLLSEAQAWSSGGPSRYDHPAHAWQRETVVRYLEHAMRAGELAPVDPWVSAEAILAAFDADRIQWFLSRGYSPAQLERDVQKLARRIIGIS
ncbi:MAG: TetR/AcrR family transcriptional regulator [Deltaproteobacteria bacterium]|nr:TetR/AcrR family transcriptional regulator [Deltaproteobacteria bacterium]